MVRLGGGRQERQRVTYACVNVVVEDRQTKDRGGGGGGRETKETKDE